MMIQRINLSDEKDPKRKQRAGRLGGAGLGAALGGIAGRELMECSEIASKTKGSVGGAIGGAIIGTVLGHYAGSTKKIQQRDPTSPSRYR